MPSSKTLPTGSLRSKSGGGGHSIGVGKVDDGLFLIGWKIGVVGGGLFLITVNGAGDGNETSMGGAGLGRRVGQGWLGVYYVGSMGQNKESLGRCSWRVKRWSSLTHSCQFDLFLVKL